MNGKAATLSERRVFRTHSSWFFDFSLLFFPFGKA